MLRRGSGQGSLLLLVLGCLLGLLSPCHALDTIAPEALTHGDEGVVWTVFRGTEPEPFKVRFVGLLKNALGPGRSMIVCELTDPRVQSMGAASGMSGSPLYFGGRMAGALSFQVQQFETVRHAGFTPVADLIAVRDRPSPPPSRVASAASSSAAQIPGFNALRPALVGGGLSPEVLATLAPHFAAAGLLLSSGQGASGSSSDPVSTTPPAALKPGSVIAAALVTGDITLGGTGTVSLVDGPRITAFGHPLTSLGDVDFLLCSAEVVTILPSSMSSIKLANIGAPIGSLLQDRLSGVSGELGRLPALIPVEVEIRPLSGPPRTLRFSTVRHPSLTPLAIATGILQGITRANDAGALEGFRLRGVIGLPGRRPLEMDELHAGPQAFRAALGELLNRLGLLVYNPFERVFPDRISLTVEALARPPLATVDVFQLSRTNARAGEVLTATVSWRDFQGAAYRETSDITVDPSWSGKTLDVVLANGSALDELTGRPRVLSVSQFRSYDSFLAALRDDRRDDGVFLAVLEKSVVLNDQDRGTRDLPGSLERMARASDETRYRRLDAWRPLQEQHLLPDRIAPTLLRRTLVITD
jgi:hypothetical protein